MNKVLEDELINAEEQNNLFNNRPKAGFVNGNRLNTDDFEELEKVEPPKTPDGKMTFMIILAVFLVINIAAILLFVFDIGGMRTKFIHFSGVGNTAVSDHDFRIGLEEERKALERERSEFEEEKKAMQEKESQLAQKQTELETLQKELGDQKLAQEANDTVKEVSGGDTPAKDLTSIVKIYENMEPKKAADILAKMDTSDVVNIIKNMKKDIAAQILSVMDAAKSSVIMKEMMQ